MNLIGKFRYKSRAIVPSLFIFKSSSNMVDTPNTLSKTKVILADNDAINIATETLK